MNSISLGRALRRASFLAPFFLFGCGAEAPRGLEASEDSTSSLTSLRCDVIVAGGSTAALAAALTAAREGVPTCLVEPTDWVGGQLTANGVPAIDYAWHTVGDYRVGDIAKAKENLPPELYAWMQPLGSPAVQCSVSKDCYEPRTLLASALEPAVAAARNLTVLRNTVVKRVTTEARNGKTVITSLTAIRRTPAASLAWKGYDARLSRDLADWYSPSPSARFQKETLTLSSARSEGPVVIDASELGEVLVLSGAPYLQGADTADGSTTTADDQCGQAFADSFVVRYDDAPVNESIDAAGPDHPEFYGFGSYDWEKIWVYRRIAGLGAPSPGQLSLQNWNPGNDYPYRYVLVSKSAAAAQRDDWRGGVNVAALEAAERHAYGWFRWFASKEPRGKGANLGLDRSSVATGHGLFKFPYLRDTRRSIGVGNFVLRGQDLGGEAGAKTGRAYADRVAIGAYAADIHPMVGCTYPGYVYAHLDTLPFYVPLRALTNRDVGNLLVAGKTMAQSFLANAATRLQPIEWSSGIGAGAAAVAMVQRHERDTANLVLAYSSVQTIARKYTPIDWTIDGTTYPRTGDALDSPVAITTLRLYCPPGASADLGLGYCVDDANAYGPFSKAMVDACKARGGGSACSATLSFEQSGRVITVPRWSRSFAAALRGTDACMAGTHFDAAYPQICVEDASASASGVKEAYGPFDARLVDRCIAGGGGDPCYSNRWSYAFFSQLAAR